MLVKPDWDTWAMGIAEAVATRSSCRRSKVGAVLLSAQRWVMSTGYNDAPPGLPGCETCPRSSSAVPPYADYRSGAGQCISVHAEVNALRQVRNRYTADEIASATLYVTRAPCSDCAEAIEQMGVGAVVHP